MSQQTLLITILISAFIMTIGILFFKEPDDNYHSSFTECLVWAAGFFLTMSIQIALITAMS